MAEVSELRMEVIFPRSTLARLTPRGVAGVLAGVADVGVTGVVVVVVAEALFLEAFAGGFGSFEGASDFAALDMAAAGFSFLSSENEGNSKSS